MLGSLEILGVLKMLEMGGKLEMLRDLRRLGRLRRSRRSERKISIFARKRKNEKRRARNKKAQTLEI